MIPVVTPDEMKAVDAAAPEPVEVLIARAGGAVARTAVEMMGGTYGRRVVIIEGKGNNGNDGREAARRLRARGVAVTELAVGALPTTLPACDLVIDAAFGTGFRGDWDAPSVESDTPVLAVDIPSGVDGLTGAARGHVLRADRTVTFAALKPGLLMGAGRDLAGEVSVADIGLDVPSARAHVIGADDVARWLPARPRETHKWQAAVWVVAGSPGMAGAAALACGGAQRAGAGYVRLSAPGGLGMAIGNVPVEVVQHDLADDGWAGEVVGGVARFGALVIGNGLGLTDTTVRAVREVVAGSTIPTVVDADGLTALGADAGTYGGEHTILTPHDGEYGRLMGSPPGADRIAAARALAARTGAVALLKGSATIVAHPDGRVLISAAGDARLATAGTGDVLAGVIGALVARGIGSFEAAAAGAFIHGSAGVLGWRHGLVARDVIDHLPAVLGALTEDRDRPTDRPTADLTPT